VVSVNQNGVEVEVLHEVPGSPAPSISITLDRVVQNAAQRAVDTRGGKAMIVVIKPSTGEILAIAQNGGADADGLLATTGPGWLLAVYRSVPADASGTEATLDAVIAVAPEILVVGSAITAAENPKETATWIRERLPNPGHGWPWDKR
jgi:cell division protein FtsI/penicillin-binding protein 2